MKFDELNLDEIDISSAASSVKLKKIKIGEWDAIGKNSSGALETVPADFVLVNSIISKLKSVRAREFVTDARGEDAKRFGFDAPTLKISLRQSNGAVQTLVAGLPFNSSESEMVYVSMAGSPSVYGISPNVLRGIPSDILSCKSRILSVLPEKAEVRKVVLSEVGGKVLFEMAQDGSGWKNALSSLPDADRSSAVKFWTLSKNLSF